VIEKASDKEYAIILFYKVGIGDAGFAAFFQAQRDPDEDLQAPPNVREVELSHGLRGFFRPVGCGDLAPQRTSGGGKVAFYIRST
jgi:hypothetical protein